MKSLCISVALVLVFSYSLLGQPYWEKQFGTDECDKGISAAIMSDGGILIWAFSKDNCRAKSSLMIKLDINGNIEWEKPYLYPTNLRIEDMIIAGDDNILITGSRRVDSLNSNYAFITMFNSTGEEVSTQFYGTEDESQLGRVLVKIADGFMIGGRSLVPAQFPVSHAYFCKIDGNYNLVWQNIITSPFDLSVYAIEESTNDSYVLLLGGGEGTLVPKFSLWKIDENGDKLWNFDYDNDSLYTCTALNMVKSETGGYFVSGTADSLGTPYDPNVFVAKISDSGGLEDFIILDEDYIQLVDDGLATDDGGYLILGLDVERIPQQLFIIKFDKNLQKKWKKYYGSDGFSRGFDIISDDEKSNIILTGSIEDDFGEADIYVIKANKEGEFNTISTMNNLDKFSVEIYPNPVHDHLSIKGIPFSQANTYFCLYDLSGELVFKQLLSEERISIEQLNLSSGLYFFQLLNDEKYTRSGKLFIH